MSQYKAGYLVELKAKDELLRQGAAIVVRSAKSHTPADLIAIFPDPKEIWLVQCKKEEAPKDLSRLAERFKDLKALEGTYTCKAYAYMKKDGKYTFLEV
jgi:hypothetical protein